MFSHRIHGIHRTYWQRVFSHRIHGIHRTDWQRCSPTEFTEFTEQTCRDVLPQNSQILTDGVCLEFCEFCVFCGTSHAPVNLCKSVQSVGGLFWLRGVYPPTEQTDRDVLPQNSQDSQNRLVEMFSHRFHGFSQMVRVWISVNSVYSVGPPTPPVDLCKSVQSVGGLFWLRGSLLCWCLLQGVQQSLLHQLSKQCTSARLVHLRQVHPL